MQTVTVNLTQCDCLYPCPFHIIFFIPWAGQPAHSQLVKGWNTAELFPASLPSDRLWLRVSYTPGWQVISPPSPLGDQEGCSMEGEGQPPPAAWPRHPTPQLPGARRGGRSAAATTVLQPPPISQASQQHTPPPATILHNMFSTVHVWRGALQQSWFTRQWVARWRPVCIAALQQLGQQQLQQQQQPMALRRKEESALTMREGR